MFQNSYQGSSSIELLTPQGKNPLKEWKCSGKIEKVFDKSVKGNIFSLESPGASLAFPKTDKSGICMVQPFLVLQVYLPLGRPLNIEVAITDSKKGRRRLMFSSSTKEFHLNPLHARIPVQAFQRNVWSNISLDIVSFSNYCFKGSTFRSIEQIVVKPHCKIRRIFTMPRPLIMYEFATPLPGQVMIGENNQEEDGRPPQCPISPIIPSKPVGEPIPKAQEFPTGVENISQVFNVQVAQFYCKANCHTPDTGAQDQSGIIDSLCGAFAPQSTSYSKRMLSGVPKSITSSGFAPIQRSGSKGGVIPLSAQSRLFVTTQESFKQSECGQTPLLKKEIKEPQTQGKTNRKLLNKINEAVSSVRNQHKKSARSNSTQMRPDYSAKSSKSSVLELSKKNSVSSPFSHPNGTISQKIMRSSHQKISPTRGISAHSTIEVESVASRGQERHHKINGSRSPSIPRIGPDMSLLAGLSSGGFEVIEEYTKKGTNGAPNSNKLPVLGAGRKNSLHKKLGLNKGLNTTATTNFTTSESWNPEALPHYQRKLFSNNNYPSSRSPNIEKQRQSQAGGLASPIQEERTGPSSTKRVTSANLRPPLAKKSVGKSPHKKCPDQEDREESQSTVNQLSPSKPRIQREMLLRNSMASRCKKEEGSISLSEDVSTSTGHTRTLSKPEMSLNTRNISDTLKDMSQEIVVQNDEEKVTEEKKKQEKLEDSMINIGKHADEEEVKHSDLDESSIAPRFNTHQFRLSTFDFARKACGVDQEDTDSDPEEVQEEINENHSQSKGSPSQSFKKQKVDQIEKQAQIYSRERNDLKKIEKLGGAFLLQTHDVQEVEEHIQITPIEDLKINRNSPCRPYTPPFAQHINPNETQSKFNILADSLEKSKDAMSVEENLEEDSLEVANDPKVEVIFDPVLKCYYDPVNNSYYELKK